MKTTHLSNCCDNQYLWLYKWGGSKRLGPASFLLRGSLERNGEFCLATRSCYRVCVTLNYGCRARSVF